MRSLLCSPIVATPMSPIAVRPPPSRVGAR
jgi:hypothetical protein